MAGFLALESTPVGRLVTPSGAKRGQRITSECRRANLCRKLQPRTFLRSHFALTCAMLKLVGADFPIFFILGVAVPGLVNKPLDFGG